MARKNNAKLRELMDEFGVKTMDDVHAFVKMLTAETIQAALLQYVQTSWGLQTIC